MLSSSWCQHSQLSISPTLLVTVGLNVGTCLCSSLASLTQNQLCQQGPSITVTERFHLQWPFTVVAFETRCLSHSCLTPFKYFKWVRCGAITWLLDKHQFIHQASDGLLLGCALLPHSKTHKVLWGCNMFTFNKTSTGQARETLKILNLIYQNNFIFHVLHICKETKGARHEFVVHDSDTKRSMYDSGIRSQWGKLEQRWRYI